MPQLKCSEERPTCAQCLKASRDCIPSSGITFRHQQNPSLNGNDEGLKSFYGYKETFGPNSIWVEVPRELTFVHTSNPYNDPEEPLGYMAVDGDASADGVRYEAPYNQHTPSYHHQLSSAAYPAYATHGLEALSAVASQDQYNYAPPAAQMSRHERTPSQTASPNQQHPGATPSTSQNLDFILNPSSTLSPSSNIDPRLHAETPVPAQHPQRQHSVSSPFHAKRVPSLRSKGLPSISSLELSFLLRHFSEGSGHWMDLFDLAKFFSATVPVLAVRCPLLLYSCAALAAKSLGRVEGRKPVFNGMITPARQARSEKWEGEALDSEGWFRKGRVYYDLAVSLLRQALDGSTRPPTSSLPADTSPETMSTAQDFPLPTTDSDELIAATAILCVYEFLDASGHEWSRHLDGAKSLFDVAKDRMVPLNLPSSPVTLAQQVTQELSHSLARPTPRSDGLSKSRLAVFWNITRQDMLSAFINNTSTRLDTADLPMWRSAGLKLDSEGFVMPSRDQSSEDAMQDDMVSNALIWILMKLVNFIAAGDDLPPEVSPLGLGVRQRELLEYWNGLDEQLRVWYDGIPDSFHATAKLAPETPGAFEEHWFPRPMCASTMQSYHFARIQLLHNKPHLSTREPLSMNPPPLGHLPHPATPGSSLAARHASYLSILQQSRVHAREIVSISLGRSEEGVRIHSVQPLWTAGLVSGIGDESGEVDDDLEGIRRTILGLLRGIQRDMGWASDYRVRSLLESWGLDEGWGEEVREDG